MSPDTPSTSPTTPASILPSSPSPLDLLRVLARCRRHGRHLSPHRSSVTHGDDDDAHPNSMASLAALGAPSRIFLALSDAVPDATGMTAISSNSPSSSVTTIDCCTSSPTGRPTTTTRTSPSVPGSDHSSPVSPARPRPPSRDDRGPETKRVRRVTSLTRATIGRRCQHYGCAPGPAHSRPVKGPR